MSELVLTPEQRRAKRSRLARLAILYLVLLAVCTISLGVFAIAFVASLKGDALSNPAELSISQLQPKYWYRAGQLGLQSGDNVWSGGLAANDRFSFTLSYAMPEGKTAVTPKLKWPPRYTGVTQGIEITSPQLIDTQKDFDYVEESGTLATGRTGTKHTYQFSIINHTAESVEVVGVTASVPKGQVLVDSSLPPARIERRGRVAAWDNVSPGVMGFVFNNYQRVLADSSETESGTSLFWKWTFNSTFIAVLKVLLTLFIAVCGGFALARFHFPGSRLIFFTMLFSMMVPGQVLFISNYLVFKDLGLMNTPWAVITAIVASGQVLIMKQFFESIPRQVEEAAYMDGAGPFRILWSIFLPMSKPALASVTILGFQGAWNDFFWPLVVLNSPAEAYTLPVGLLSLRNAYGVTGDWGLILAGSFLSMIPVLMIFIFFQRYFIENDSSSAVKG